MNLFTTDFLYRQIKSIWQETSAWPEFVEAMQLVFPESELVQDPTKDPARWASLPGLCCEAAGGDPEWADDLALAWFLFYTAAHLFDQVEDQDPFEEGTQVRTPAVAINLATGLLLAASFSLNRIHQDTRIRGGATEIVNDFYRSMLTMCFGQHTDLVTPQPTLQQWLQIASAKSGTFFQLACRAGARMATDKVEIIEAFGEYGFHMGVVIQILDDLGDFRQVANSGELTLSKDAERSVIVAYARDVLPPEQQLKFMEILASAPKDLNATQAITDLLIQYGTELYLDIEIEHHRELGIAALITTNSHSPAGETLLNLLNNLGKDSFPQS